MATRKTINQAGEATQGELATTGSAIDRVAFEESILALMEAIPEAGENDDIAVYAQLMAAADVEGFELGDHLPAGKDLIGRRLKVSALVRRISDIELEDADVRFKLPFYLVIDSVDVDSGESVRWQTSSPGICIVLAKLHAWGQLPALVRIVETGKAKAGRNRPLNLIIEAVSPRGE